MSLSDEWKKRKENSLSEQWKRENKKRDEELSIKQESKISSFDNLKKNTLKEIGTQITNESEQRRQEENRINQEIQKQVNAFNTNFNNNNKKTVSLPLPEVKDNQYNYRNVMQENIQKNLLPTNMSLLTEKDKEKFVTTGKIGNGNLFKATNGKVDDRSSNQKIIDNIIAPIANIAVGVESVVPSIANYENAAMKKISKLGVEGIARNFTDSEKSKLIGDVLGGLLYNNNSKVKKLNKDLEKEKEWRNSTIQSNINKTTNIASKKIAELAPSLGQNILPIAVASTPVPGARLLSTTMFMTSAGGNYLDDAKARGMNEDEAFGYATVMGIAEGGSESLISGKMLSNAKQLITGKGISETFLNSLGTEITENFAQEAIMEPLQEATAQIIGGKNAANWDNIGERTLQAGLDGVLSAVLLKGASVGIISSQNTINKINNGQQVTEQELNNALNDIKSSGKVDIKGTIQGAINAIKEKSIEFKNSTSNLQQNQTSRKINDKINNYLNKNNLQMSADEFIERMSKVTLENEVHMTPEQEELYNLISEIQKGEYNILEENENMSYNNIKNDTEVNYGRRESSNNRGYGTLRNEQIINNQNIIEKESEDNSDSFSMKDNQERPLSKEQQEYFKDSKIRDKNGKLKTLYHGSNSKFTTFDLSKSGKASKESKVGFWFTDSKEGAEKFASETTWYGEDTPTTYETYLNIKNPKIYEFKSTKSEIQNIENNLKEIKNKMAAIKEKYEHSNITLSDILMLKEYAKYTDNELEYFKLKTNYNDENAKKLIHAANEYLELRNKKYKYENERENLGYDDSYEQFKTELYSMVGQTARDANLGGIGMALDDYSAMEKLRNNLIKQGYDGIIIKETKYDARSFGEKNNQYVAFYPEQIKNVNNINPTTNPDITKEKFNQYTLEGFNNEPENNLSKENWKRYQASKIKTEKILEQKGRVIQVEKRKFAKDFIDNKYIDLRGKTVENSTDIADIAQIYRNPKYETFRVIYLKENTVVGQEAISSRIPGHTNIFTDKNQGEKGYYRMNDRMKRLGADSYYLIHNHPSGNAKASQADLNVTQKLSNKVPGFKGHIIINSGTYAIIEKESGNPFKMVNYNELKINNYKPDEIDKMMSNEPWANKTISRDELINIAYDLKNNPNYSNLIIADSSLKGRIILDIPNSFFNMSEKQINGYIKNIAKENGGMRAFIATQDINVFNKLDTLETVQDGVLFSTDSNGNLKVVGNMDVKSDIKIFKDNEGKGLRVNEKIEDIYNSLFNINNNQKEKKFLDIQQNIKFQVEDINLPKASEIYKLNNKEKTELLTDTDYEVLNKIYEKEGKTEILTEKKKANLLEKYANDKYAIKDSLDILAQKFINKGHYIDQLAEKTNNLELKFIYDKNLNSFAEGQYVVGVAQTDNKGNEIGKSINEIWEPIENSNLTKEFSEYLLHKHNIDRSERGKYIFGEEIGAAESTSIALELEKKYPEFKKYAEDIKKFNHNNLMNLKEAGMLTQDTIDYIEAMYPNYIAISRNLEEKLYTGSNEKTGAASPLKKAVGGNSDIQPIKDTMAQQAIKIKRLVNQNELGKELSKTLKDAQVDEGVDIELSPTLLLDIDTMVDTDNQGNKYYLYFENGKQIKLKINDNLYESLKPTEISKLEKTFPVKALQKVTNIHRSLLTSSNPIFVVTNFFKDFQDGAFNSKYSSKFIKNYGKALNEIITNGKYYQSYMANGGMTNTYFDYNEGIKKHNKFAQKIRNINEIVEQLPRMAEFISTLEDGKSLNEALYNAAEITTNFKRGGDIAKALNRNGVNFLNASIQGLDKQFRNFSGQNGAKGYTNLLAKAAIMSIIPSVINHMLLDDDDDYQDLPQSTKDLYYLFKYDDGKFIRIPKGRVLSIFGAAARRTLESIQRQEDAWDGFGETIINQIAPNNPLEDNILAPIAQVKNNKTWYGGDLVSSRLQEELPENQYDETTDEFSKWLGKQIKISPKKINYLIDQYSGGIGDVILPIITPQAKQNVLVDKFTTDSVLKNKNVSKFYETLEKQTQIANDSFATDEDQLQLKYLNSISRDMSVLYKQKREIQMSNISNTEKTRQVKEIQSKINELAEKGLTNYSNVNKTNNSSKIGDEEYYRDSKGKWTTIDEEEKAKIGDLSLDTYSEYKQKVYEKTQEKKNSGELTQNQILKDKDKIQILLDSKYSDKEITSIYESQIKSTKDTQYNIISKSGIDIKEYLKYKQQEFESDKKDDGTTTGKTVSGSKKKKVYNYVNSMNITYNQKLLLLGMQYNLTNTEKTKLANYVNSMKLTKQEKLDIYEKLSGFTVYKSGKVTW